MRLEFVERGLDFPLLVVQIRQFFGGSVLVVQNSSDEAVDRIGVRNLVHVVVDHRHYDGVAISSPVRGRRIDAAEIRTVRQRSVRFQDGIAAGSPEQIRTGLGCGLREFVAGKESVIKMSVAPSSFTSQK